MHGSSNTPKPKRAFGFRAQFQETRVGGTPEDIPVTKLKAGGTVTARPHFRTPFRTETPLDKSNLVHKDDVHSGKEEHNSPLRKRPRRCEPVYTIHSKANENDDEGACESPSEVI